MKNRDIEKCRRVVDQLMVASIDAELDGQFVLSNELRQQWRGARKATSKAIEANKRPYGSALKLRLSYVSKAKSVEDRGEYVQASNLRDRARGVAKILAVLRAAESNRRQRMKAKERECQRRYAAKRRLKNQLA